ncbi:MAG: ATP synthase F1 subunit delta [Magnetococcales bacterium]|nr:ATP synthase F1 subunit delta [Magnetococcales bacterium]
MHDSTLAKRYASALAELATEGDRLEKVGEDLGLFLELINMTPSLSALLASPTVSKGDQHKIIDSFASNDQVEAVTGNFLRVLIDKRRMGIFSGIVASYNRMVEERSGRITIQLASAKPLNKKHEEGLATSLSSLTGKEVQLDVSTDSTLLGGVVVRVGSVMMDYSVRGHLNRLKSQMRG